MMNLMSVLIVVSLLTGCASVTYHRTQYDANGKITSRQTETANALLMKGAVDTLRSSTKDKDYSHRFAADGIEGKGDAETAGTVERTVLDFMGKQVPVKLPTQN